MDEMGDEFNDISGDDKTGEELPELTSESDEPDEFDDEISEVFSEPDEFDDEIPEVFSEPDEFDDEIPEVFSEPDEFDDEISEVFSEPDEFDDEIPEVFSEPDEFDGDIPEVFSEADEIDDILDDTIQDKEDGERADEDQGSGDVGNVIGNENIGPQSTSTVLTSEIEEIECNMEHQEQEEEIEIRPEEYQGDTEPIVNADEIEFIKDVEELAEHARETKGEDDSIEPQAEKDNAAYYAEQYYETLKEKEVVNDQNSKEEQEAEELRQEVTEELKGDQEKGYKSDELEEEDIIKASKEITSTEEFEYLWEVRDKLDREGKTSEEIEEVMHEAEEMYETLKNAENLYEEQELEKLKLVDHEDEATEEDLKEELDRVDLVEQAIELEEKLYQQGQSQEGIDARVEESIETTKFEENLEEIIEAQELEKLKLVDHEDEATEEDQKEVLDRVDLVEQAIELEEKLYQQGQSQEGIDARVEESIETTKFGENLEEIIEEQELEKLKLVDHEDEATEEDLKEELDRVDLIEQAVELEEELFQQMQLQEEIDARVEESVETTKSEENLEEIIELEQESIVNKKLKKHDLEINEQISNENVENEENLEVLKPELDAMESESDEEEDERLQELYRQETNRRPIYARKKTKSYSQWLEQRELGAEKIKNSKSESEKIKEIEEEGWKTTLKQWIREASEEECNAELKSELKKALESYNEFEDLIRKFLELYEKSQHEKLSEKENNRLKSLTERLQELGPNQLELLANIRAFKDYFYNHLWELMNRFFVIRVRSKFFKHVSQKYKELRKEQKNEKIKYLNNYRVNQGNLGENSLNPLTSKQIKKYEQIYHRKLEALCVKYALDFKNIIIDEYGYNILGLRKQIPLSSYFGFRLDKHIRFVSHHKRDRAVGACILERVRLHVVEKFYMLEKNATKEKSFRKIVDFIMGYKKFSQYVSGKFSMSHIKYQQDSEELASKSWLFENLRYIFPKKFGFPISDNLLSCFIYGDSSANGRKSKLIRTTFKGEINKHIYLAELLSIDYSANKLTKEAFSNKDIVILDNDLSILKENISFLIYYYVFCRNHESPYVSKTTNSLEVGKDYFTIEYNVIRAIFFAIAEENNGKPMSFETIKNTVGLSTSLNKHLVQGFGFGDDFVILLAYLERLFKNKLKNSNSQVFQNTERILNEYKDAYKARRRELQRSRGYRSAFQEKVHNFIEDFLGLKFNSEEQVRAVVKDNYVTTINDNFIKEKIYVHSSFAFDGYLDLSKALKDYLGLDDKWIGIAFEANGEYWHSLPVKKEADRKKRLICREKNIILLEIPESLNFSAWKDEIIKQFKKYHS